MKYVGEDKVLKQADLAILLKNNCYRGICSINNKSKKRILTFSKPLNNYSSDFKPISNQIKSSTYSCRGITL
jgi:hypothetical protein